MESIPGVLSARAVEEHYELYQGYKDTLARVDLSLRACPRPAKHLVDHPYRALKEAESFAIGGVFLHELYFDNLTPNPIAPPHEISQSIILKFCSIQEFLQELRAVSLTARGWAVLGMCEINPSDLRIFMLDSHNTGPMFGYSPLLAIDVYEHAMYMDYGTDRVAYVDNVLKVLDWNVINQRYLESLSAIQSRHSYRAQR